MARKATYPEYVYDADGNRVPSPYVEQRYGSWFCLACDCSLDNAQHLEKKTHKTRAWYWCFGCTDRGYEQRARAPTIVWDSQELTPKFWSNSPTDVPMPAAADGAAGGGQWTNAAQQAIQDQEPPAAAAGAAIASPPGLVHSEDTKAILAEIEKSRDELANEIATVKRTIATHSSEVEDKIEQLAAAIAGISAILNDMCPRGTSGLRTLSGSASAGSLTVPYDQHRTR